MNYFKKKCGAMFAVGIASFLMLGGRTDAMEDVYRNPVLSGPTQTWVYQGETYENSRNRVFADDQEDGDLTKDIRQSGNVDTSKTGSSTITFQVTDSDGRTATMQTVVKVLDRKNASAEDKTVRRVLYTLPDASHLTNIEFNRGYYHDRQSLGIWVPEGETLTIRLVNGEEFKQDLELNFMNNDSETEKMSIVGEKTDELTEPASTAKIPCDGEWVTVKNRYIQDDGTEGSADSVPFIITPKNTAVQPIIEIQWNDDLEEIPYYRYGDNQADFFSKWNETQAPFAIIEGDAATFLVPVVDKDNIINHSGVSEAYQFRTIDEMLEWYAAFVRQYDAYSGLDFNASEPYNQNVRAKFFIKVNYHGIGAAYYSWDHSAMNAEKGGYNSEGSLGGYLTRDWVSLHEFGHGYEGSIAQQENPFVETTNNILGYYFEPTYRPDSDFGWLLYDFYQYDTKEERYAALGKRAEDRRNETTTFSGIVEGAQYYNVSLFMFTNVLDKLGAQQAVSAMHTQYRKYCYENGKTTSSSDVITESFSRAGGYNVAPYFESWHIRPSEKVENTIYDMDKPMVYYLKDIIPDDRECKAVRSHLNLDGIYSLVSTDDLAYTGYKSQVNIQIKIDDISVIKNKNVVIKNGEKVVKRIPVTSNKITTELPVGIYEVELPVPTENSYYFGGEYLVASKGNVSAKYEYLKKKNPLADDVQIKLLGISDVEVASVSVDSDKHTLTWKVNNVVPHSYFEDYISVRVLDASGKEIFSQSLAGNEKAKETIRELSFPEGSRIEICHQEAKGRLKAVSSYTGKELTAYNLPDGAVNVTYVMTDKGLMQEDWNEERQMDVWLKVLTVYSDDMVETMTQEDLYRAEKFHNQKVTAAKALEFLDEDRQEEYLAKYGVLVGEAPEAYTGYHRIDSTKLTGIADSEQGGNEAAGSALDEKEDTIWHSNYSGGKAPDIASEINNGYTIVLDKNRNIGRLDYVPRRGGGNGVILSYRLFYSTTEDGDDFQEIPVKNSVWQNNDSVKSVEFDAPNARRIRITALSTAGDTPDTHISAAEFYLYEKTRIFSAETYVSDLYLETSGTSVQKDKNMDGQALSLLVNGKEKTFTKGIGMAAGSSAVLDLTGKDFEVFSAMAGVDASQAGTDGAVLEIYGDGKLLCQTEPLMAGNPAQPVYLDIRGIGKLEIKVTGGSGNAGISLGDASLKSSRDLTEITLKEGELAAIAANMSLIPSDRNLTWKSSDEKIAVVNGDGVVTAVGAGEVVVSGISGTETITCAVHVVNLPNNDLTDEKAKRQEALSQAKAVYDAGQGNYTLESWMAFQAAYEALNRATDNMGASELEGLIEKLKEAQRNLEEKASGGTPEPNPSVAPEPVETIKEGQIYDSGNYYYKVTSISKMTAQVTGIKKKGLKKITIYNTVTLGGKKYQVTSIAPSAFKNNKKITSVTIQKNVEVIGNSAFAGCSNLKKVTAKSTKLKNIGTKAFSGCKKLTSITIKSRVLKKAGKNAFKGISKKAVIKVPASKLKAYTKLLAKKGQSKTVKIKK